MMDDGDDDDDGDDGDDLDKPFSRTICWGAPLLLHVGKQ